jgi:hypothetical protein
MPVLDNGPVTALSKLIMECWGDDATALTALRLPVSSVQSCGLHEFITDCAYNLNQC